MNQRSALLMIFMLIPFAVAMGGFVGVIVNMSHTYHQCSTVGQVIYKNFMLVKPLHIKCAPVKGTKS
jgi:hypothetical protein